MLPIRDDNPTSRTAWVTLVIIALNVAAFLLWQPTFGNETDQEIFFFCHAEIPWEVVHQTNIADGGAAAATAVDHELGRGAGEALQALQRSHCPHKSWWQSVFVAMFLHGSWLHIGGNMLFLWVFGNNVEDKLGVIKYILFYLASGIAASLAQIVIDANSVIPNLGASGAIAGVLGAYLVMFPRRRVYTIIIFFFITAVYLPAFVVLGAWFVLQVFSGVGSLSSRIGTGGGVAFFAHIGGFVFGALMALLFFPKERLGARPPPQRPDMFGRSGGWMRRRRQPPPGSFGGWGSTS